MPKSAGRYWRFHDVSRYSSQMTFMRSYPSLDPTLHIPTWQTSSLVICTADNDMQLNTSKTKVMILGRMMCVWVHPFHLNSSWPNPARHCSHYLQVTVLGFHLDTSLSWPERRRTSISLLYLKLVIRLSYRAKPSGVQHCQCHFQGKLSVRT